ncbi:MAG: 3-isopropylmalate dehydrogenase [uncultured bacterium (gcode 4)]|uniref:3-isopropylmalate dehydrogenase n=1 Tax=uncultured bacterium (gcode 4) TaxID=1234023 RepID=K2FCY8_9BACT|nr:MAG: 3-isopropylmalate dehydrogenase [uncultured bacterium (gcode 4)]
MVLLTKCLIFAKMKLNQKQKILFLDNLWSLLNSGIPVMQALDIISFQVKNKRLDTIISFIKSNIWEWENFFKIALKLPWVFNIFDAAMIETWEATGKIWRAFEVIVLKEEKEYDLIRKVRQALIYPVAIIIITFVMLSIIMTYVIPKIEWIYAESNVNLPPLTQAVIDTSHFFVNNLLYVVIGIFALIIIISQSYRYFKAFKFAVDKNILEIPIFGEIIRKKTLVHFADFLSTLLGSGIIINKALLIIRNAMSNSFYANAIDVISKEVKLGQSLSSSMWVDILDKQWNMSAKEKKAVAEKNKAFPIEISTAVRIWEQTWSLSVMLHKTSVRYTKEIDNTVKNLSTMLEPMIIVFIGSIVWVIIMAIMLPFLNIANVVK